MHARSLAHPPSSPPPIYHSRRRWPRLTLPSAADDPLYCEAASKPRARDAKSSESALPSESPAATTAWNDWDRRLPTLHHSKVWDAARQSHVNLGSF